MYPTAELCEWCGTLRGGLLEQTPHNKSSKSIGVSGIWPDVSFPRPIRESDRMGDPLDLGTNRTRFKQFLSLVTTEKYTAISAQWEKRIPVLSYAFGAAGSGFRARNRIRSTT